MTEEHSQPEPPVPPTTPPPPIDAPPVPHTPQTPPKKRLTPLAAGLLGLIVGAGLVGATWAVTANQDPETFTLEGAFALTDEVYSEPGSENCRGSVTSGYDDIAEGTSVTVYGAGDDVIATGHLGPSEPNDSGTICTFEVVIEDVPKGEKFYKVEVSHRGTVQLTAEEAENGELFASLG
ncbi:hypothetical protein [Streptomyces zhihengii]|uniref:DUF4333 domain-containing protein n=1 Tax=Streptomyces zhihengii TaxID=1818004 RepID=A0ABS2V4K4_9ACTN|nr:hypothetical protein [Streptomyces zhihengii]MBM9624653.1 hypothetical protein [Streptomyces zhihengii]